MSYPYAKLKNISIIKTGKLDSNAAVANGKYPFFTCDPNTLSIDEWAYDTEAVLLAGNNASGNYTAKYYSGRFNAYQRTYIIETSDKDILDVRFLASALNQQLQLLKTISSGSTTKFLTIRMLHDLDIPLPDIRAQRRIADTLSAYDDLIENNRKQIELLEETAQRLYQEWFVDLRFPGHEHTKIVDGVPEGWEKRLLGDIVEVKYGKDHKSFPDGLIPVYGSGGFMRKCNQALYDGESVLIPRKGSLNNIIYVDEAFWTVDTMFYTKMKLSNIGIYVFFFVKSFDMYSMNIGAAVPSMTTNILNALDIIIPNNDVLRRFQSISKIFFNKIALLHKQIETATQARDRLLPKLMSGEVEV